VTTTVQDKAKLIVIQTDKGKVRCSQFDTHLEGLGIPYAAPPVGDLRLRAPIEHAAWTDVRDATKFGPASLQTKTEYDEAQGSEDCLYLNVYIRRCRRCRGCAAAYHDHGVINEGSPMPPTVLPIPAGSAAADGPLANNRPN
jgi:hypothetical protein